MDPEQLNIVVRQIQPTDLEPIVHIDAKASGDRRLEYFRRKLQGIAEDSSMGVSLAAELDHQVVGFLLARVHFGEYGRLQQTAVLDSLGVAPEFAGRGVGKQLLSQLTQNLRGLQVGILSTEVGWDKQSLASFFQHEGFVISQRVCLELSV